MFNDTSNFARINGRFLPQRKRERENVRYIKLIKDLDMTNETAGLRKIKDSKTLQISKYQLILFVIPSSFVLLMEKKYFLVHAHVSSPTGKKILNLQKKVP